LQSKTGIEHSCPEDSSSDRFCSGNFAFAQYFADEEHHDLIYSTCLKIETALSEVSIWEDNELIHQCNLKFAEQDLLFQFLEQNPHFLERQFGANLSEWQGLQRDVFNTKLETLLDWESEEWLRRTRPTLIYTPEVQGLVQLMAIGLASLYYYIGLLLGCYITRDNMSGKNSPQYIWEEKALAFCTGWITQGGLAATLKSTVY